MSGHSKWSTIKRKKGAADARKGKLFSKISREISIAARLGGGDPGANPRLRNVLSKAKAANMPQDNITRAIKRGTGEIEGAIYEEATYEAYGPGGVALLIETLTDNKNRTVAELKHLLSKYGGTMGESGCVAWMFTKHGVITFNKGEVNEDELMEVALASGAEDIKDEEVTWDVITTPEKFEAVKEACISKGLKPQEANITLVPQTTISLEGAEAERMLKLMDALEDCDDVQNVYSNFDIDVEIMEKMV